VKTLRYKVEKILIKIVTVAIFSKQACSGVVAFTRLLKNFLRSFFEPGILSYHRVVIHKLFLIMLFKMFL
jgi:hypothetical protein